MQVSILALDVHRLLITFNRALRLTATQAESPLSEQKENAYVKLDSVDKEGNQSYLLDSV